MKSLKNLCIIISALLLCSCAKQNVTEINSTETYSQTETSATETTTADTITICTTTAITETTPSKIETAVETTAITDYDGDINSVSYKTAELLYSLVHGFYFDEETSILDDDWKNSSLKSFVYLLDMNNDGNYQIMYQGFSVLGCPYWLISLDDFEIITEEGTRCYHEIYKNNDGKDIVCFKYRFTFDEYDLYMYNKDGTLQMDTFYKKMMREPELYDIAYGNPVVQIYNIDNVECSYELTEDEYNIAYEIYLADLTLVTDECLSIPIYLKDFDSVEKVEIAIRPLFE